MGEVFVARTPWNEDPIAAVKRLRPDVARVPTFSERFQHEAELAVRLSHPRIVRTLDVSSVDGHLYVASELVEGKDTGLIADRLRHRGEWGPAEVAIRILLDGLEGLAYVHRAQDADGTPLGLLHRDITPGNVLLGYDGGARLADFGLAKSALSRNLNLTHVGEILGTPHYLAPELVQGESASIASDLYGLGAVLYRFLTGVPPHQGPGTQVLKAVLHEMPRPLSELRPDLDPWLPQVVHGFLAKDPHRRPDNAATAHRQVLELASDCGLLVPRDSVGKWLEKLFASERQEERDERERLLSLSDPGPSDPGPGTVVLARPVVDERLADPRASELSGSEASVPVQARPVHSPHEDSPRWPPTPPRFELHPGSTEFDELMETQAVRVQPIEADPEHTDRSLAPRVEPSIPASNLPGFVEHKSPSEPPDPSQVQPSKAGVPGPSAELAISVRPAARQNKSLGRNQVLGGMALALGLGLGFSISTWLGARSTRVEMRLLDLRTQMVESEQPVSAEAWRKWSEAAEKVMLGDLEGAEESMDELAVP